MPKYVANFGEEVGGKIYAAGAVVSSTKDTETTLEVLARMGRVSRIAEDGDAVGATGADDAVESSEAQLTGTGDRGDQLAEGTGVAVGTEPAGEDNDDKPTKR